ncbi:UDP-2,3-diacylglucosamine diphosphatase [Muricoccus vinaceus]|uniref:UDP-2,3-diacylglucosamine diphosphatase n=1 Tax=Muricoccus vinaceus TaxID=424704 RepID=A0ABV6IXS4_9PROT
MQHAEATRQYRSVFISDVHVGTRGCRAEFLADFLRSMACEQLYLVGDIVDGWRLRKSWYWDAHHDEVIRLVLRHARHGSAVTYIPGNHDEKFRDWHIHHAEMRENGGIVYRNDGDWVESCTALVEHFDGRFELVAWAEERKLSFFRPRRAAEPALDTAVDAS